MSKLDQRMLSSNTVWLHIAFIVVAFVFAYYDTLISFVQTWSGRDDYSHGFVVPFASLYFVYAMRNTIKAVYIEPQIVLGLAITLTGALVLVFGKAGSMITVQQFSVLLVMPGLVILLLGFEMFKTLLLPLGYITLMIPLILDVIFSPLHWPFQIFGANIAAIILKSLGIPVYHSAQYLQLTNASLEVANACSGIRYLVSIIALAIPLAYLTIDSWSRRIVLVASSVMIGILANPIRISLIGLWVYNGGSILHGPGHMLQGYFISVVGFIFLFGAAFFLSRPNSSGMHEMHAHSSQIGGKSTEKYKSVNCVQIGEVDKGTSCTCQKQNRKIKTAWVSAIAVLLALGCIVNYYEPKPVYLTSTPASIPLEIDGWNGQNIDGKYDSIVTLPDPDIEIRRSYRDMSGENIYFIAGYYDYQRQDKEIIHYTMQKLYDRTEESEIEVTVGHYITAKKVLVQEGGKKWLVLYWYDIDGYETSDNIKAKCLTAMRGILERKTNGAIILIAREVTSKDNMVAILQRQESFIALVYPSLKEYLLSY